MANSDTELQKLFEQQLKPKLAGLEELRQKVKKYRIFTFICIGIMMVPFLVEDAISHTMGEQGYVLFIFGIIGLVYNISKGGKLNKKYRSIYKSEIVHAIVKIVNPDWSYQPNQCITEEEYQRSGLFVKSYDRYYGDDLVYGKIGQTDFRSSELKTEYKTESRDSKGNRKETWHTIFNGFFFHADFNKDFKGRTYVAPDSTEKYLGSFARKLQSFSGKGELVEMENPEFEKQFVVHSTNQIEARYILTPAIMEALLSIRYQYNKDVHFAFIKSRVYCAIEFNEKLLEPKVFSSGVDFYDIRLIYDIFKINELLIKELDLNTRIWTKV